jgi:uncharacterized protein YciI
MMFLHNRNFEIKGNTMKHFIIIIHYIESLDIVNGIRPHHREFLEKGYKNGTVLFSGPQVPRKGGIIAARGKTSEEVKKFFSEDPYQKEKAAEYQFIEFEPVHYQKFIEEWIAE